MARLIEVSKHFRVGSASLETEKKYIYISSLTPPTHFLPIGKEWQNHALNNPRTNNNNNNLYFRYH